MNILGLVSFNAFPAKMGGQKGVADFYGYLSEKTTVYLDVSLENEQEANKHFTVFRVLPNHWWGWLYLFKIPLLVKQIRGLQIDVLIIEHSYFGWMGFLLQILTGKPFVIHSHNIETERFKIANRFWWRGYRVYEKWAHRKASHIFYKCDEDAQYFLDLLGNQHPPYSIIPYGIHAAALPSAEVIEVARKWIRAKHKIDSKGLLFLFNGTLDYAPNTDAVEIIIRLIIPVLRTKNIPFKIILCGNRINSSMESAIKAIPEIIWAGYVEDLDSYLRGVDAFIQPSVKATGIKTKLVEALANDLTVITTVSGARGLQQAYLKDKLIQVNDMDIAEFINKMIVVKEQQEVHTPPAFFEAFNWKQITTKACLSLQQL